MNCQNCGACCRILPIAINKPTEEEIRTIDMRQHTRHDIADGIHYIIVASCCRYLNDGLCTIHERKPEYCKNFKCGGAECLLARKIEGIE